MKMKSTRKIDALRPCDMKPKENIKYDHQKTQNST